MVTSRTDQRFITERGTVGIETLAVDTRGDAAIVGGNPADHVAATAESCPTQIGMLNGNRTVEGVD
ncbi:hypothetical protein D3C85_1507470 [compost metagenome]